MWNAVFKGNNPRSIYFLAQKIDNFRLEQADNWAVGSLSQGPRRQVVTCVRRAVIGRKPEIITSINKFQECQLRRDRSIGTRRNRLVYSKMSEPNKSPPKYVQVIWTFAGMLSWLGQKPLQNVMWSRLKSNHDI